MFHHKAIVGGDVRLTLNGIDDYALCRGAGRRTQLDEGGESRTTHASDTSYLNFLYDLFGSEVGMLVKSLKFLAAVDALLPFVALHINNYDRLAVASGIESSVYLCHLSGN